MTRIKYVTNKDGWNPENIYLWHLRQKDRGQREEWLINAYQYNYIMLNVIRPLY